VIALKLILPRYVLRIVAHHFLAVSGVLLLIVVVLQFTRVLARAAAERFPSDLLWSIIAWGAVQNIAVILPIGLSLGIVLALGRLHEDQEIAAMDACGAGGVRITLSVVVLVAAVAAVLAALSLLYNPLAAAKADAHKTQALLRSAYLNPKAGEFRVFGSEQLVLYAETVDALGRMRGVFAYQADAQSALAMVARAARIERGVDGLPRALVLTHGTLYWSLNRDLRQRIVRFEEQRIGVRLPTPHIGPTPADALQTANLLRSTRADDLAELHGRLAQPVMALVLGGLAIRLARLGPRQSRYSRAALLILIYFVYTNVLTAGETWIVSGRIPASLGLWWVHALVLFGVMAPYAGLTCLRRFFGQSSHAAIRPA
jgi:lipopolysaccharide export system permease protein